MEYSVTPNALKNKVILVTGASDGIGKQAALSYAGHGANIILLGRSQEKLHKAENEIKAISPAQTLTISMDMLVADKKDYIALAKTIEQQFGKLDAVLHSAGALGSISPFEQISEETFDEVMQINVKAQFLMTQALLPLLHKSDDARIVFTSSTVGHSGRALWGTYSISKFATEGMMQVLADELRDTNIKVNAINPGATRTDMRAKAYPSENPDTLKTPLDIMPLYLYLMAPEGEEVNGQCIDAQPK